MARTSIASDNFNSYTDASNLGDAANWLELNNSTGLIRVHKPAADGFAYEHFQQRSECRWDGSGTFSNDQYASVTLAQFFITADPDMFIGPAVRMSADTLSGRDYYGLFVYDAANTSLTSTHVVKYVNNSPTDIYAKATGDNWTNGDVATLEAVTNGSNVDLKVYKNGNLLRTVSDTSGTLTTGKPGLAGVGNSTAGQAPATTLWDGGDVTADPTLSNFFVSFMV